MSKSDSAENLARVWIERWNDGAPDLIPLAENFTHTSPLGRAEGRQKFLDWVKPMAARNVKRLRIKRILSSSNEAAVHFEMQTPNGVTQVCDWLVVKDGQITAIQSFYDPTESR